MDFTEEELAAEEWRPVVGYEEYYHVSDLGRVKSLQRTGPRMTRWGKFHTFTNKEKILKQGYTADGYYLGVALCVNGVAKTHDVHPLVMKAFKGVRPERQDVAHNDGDGHNNRLGNLRYDTREGNMADCAEHGKWSWGTQRGGKLTADDVWYIRRMQGKVFQRDLGNKFGVSQQVIQKVQARLTYRAVVDAP